MPSVQETRQQSGVSTRLPGRVGAGLEVGLGSRITRGRGEQPPQCQGLRVHCTQAPGTRGVSADDSWVTHGSPGALTRAMGFDICI